MLNAIAGVFDIDGGSIVIDGEDITRRSEHKRAAFIGRVFQDPMMGTAPTMTIEENSPSPPAAAGAAPSPGASGRPSAANSATASPPSASASRTA